MQPAAEPATLLLDRIASGDQDAVAELYDLHSGRLFGLLVHIMKDRCEAEELLQDVFVQVWKRASSYDPSRGSAVGWLCAVTRNRAIDRFRSRARRVVMIDQLTGPAAPETPEALASRGQQYRDIHRVLDSLPDDQRKLIEHAYCYGATQSEMALQFSLPLGTVKTRMRTALQTLRQALDTKPIEP